MSLPRCMMDNMSKDIKGLGIDRDLGKEELANENVPSKIEEVRTCA